ncbi:MAG: hypothetical protein ACF8LK_03745 [Phycisphaerales bacterium JB041]
MSETPSTKLTRLAELAADESLGQISVEDRAELEVLREQLGETGESDALGELILGFDAASGGGEEMPDDVAARLIARGRAVVGAGTEPIPFAPARSSAAWKVALVAAAVVAAVSVTVAVITVSSRTRATEAWNAERQTLLAKAESNQALLAEARGATEQLRLALAERDELTESQREEILAARERELEYAQRLADATSTIDALNTRVAMYEEPIPPEVLAINRQKLLDVPDTVQIAWAPFDVEGGLAEQRQVTGDVVWNDALEEGYLRFVGLEPNDPNVEQYQVWVIDRRGMEQKVSGGVFDVNERGEIIVPIDPSLDVSRVSLFAITIEEPGGTVVPDLRRRVVYAPVEG